MSKISSLYSLISTIVIIILLLVFWLINQISNSQIERQSIANSMNARRVHFNMSKEEVLCIMGDPDTIMKFDLLELQYNPPSYASSAIYFGFDSFGVMQKISRNDSVFIRRQ